MAQQQAAPTYTKKVTSDVSIYPIAKRVKQYNQHSSIAPSDPSEPIAPIAPIAPSDPMAPSAPTLNVLFPNIKPETIAMFWYLTQTFSVLKELYDTYSLRMVLECINIHPFQWEKLDFSQQKEYLAIRVKTEEYMKQHNF